MYPLYGTQRGIYLRLSDASFNFVFCKDILRHSICPERLAAKHKTSVPLVLCPRSSARRAEHARSYGTAAAQQVNFVGCRIGLFSHSLGSTLEASLGPV